MHIFYPIGSFYPAQSGGPSNSIYWLAKALTACGHHVTVLATSHDIEPPTPLDRWIDTDFGRVQYVRTRWLYLPVRHIVKSIELVRKADIVHLTSIFYPPSLVLAFVGLLHGKAIVWSPRGEFDPEALVYNPALKRFIISILRFVAKRFLFHSTCAAETEYIRQQLGRQVQVDELPNYMELPIVVTARPGHYLLAIGRIHPKKALDQLINGLAESRVFKEDGWQLYIAGTGDEDYIAKLKQQSAALNLQNNICWLGLLQGPDKQELFANAYLTILPSHTENFGNVVIESLAQGTPVIASTGTPWQMLGETQAGIWTANDPESLSEAIDKMLLLSFQEYALYRKRALELVRKRFDIFVGVTYWETVYRQALRSFPLTQ